MCMYANTREEPCTKIAFRFTIIGYRDSVTAVEATRYTDSINPKYRPVSTNKTFPKKYHSLVCSTASLYTEKAFLNKTRAHVMKQLHSLVPLE